MCTDHSFALDEENGQKGQTRAIARVGLARSVLFFFVVSSFCSIYLFFFVVYFFVVSYAHL